MIFRVWFLYFGKFWVALFAFIFLSFAVRQTPLLERLRSVALALLTMFCVIGAVQGILWVLGRLRFACPICGTTSHMIYCGKHQPGLDCPQCAVVYCKNYAISMQIIVEPPDDDTADEPELPPEAHVPLHRR
jgi:hypothetical protein